MAQIGKSNNPYRRSTGGGGISANRAPRLSVGRGGAFQEEDDDEDDGMPWGNWGTTRNRVPSEDSSLKKIKTVQGEEGRWTVTDCDADKKAEKSVRIAENANLDVMRLMCPE